MQPNQGILADRSQQLFAQGRWDELERVYRSQFREDGADARTAFRLGNLLAYQEKYSESLRFFDTAWAHKWPGALPYNNKGVALACLGETRAAFQTLSKASEHDGRCAPAFYNLGILCIKLGNEGTLPQVLLDLGLGARDQKPGALAKDYFEKAEKGQWPDAARLDRPLLLWTEDLKPGFGFEPVTESAEIADAEEVFQEGVALFRQERWEDAIAKLEAAARLHMAFAPRIVPLRTAAQVEIVRQRRAAARELWEQGDHEGAAQLLDTVVGLSSDLPNRAFAEEILAAGIQDLARQIREHRPTDGWLSLQRLITAARQRFEDEPETAGEKSETTPGQEQPQAAPEGGSPALDFELEEDDPSRSYIRHVCRRAWDDQIDHLVLTGSFEDAIQLLEFSEVQWFARADLPRWRRRVYTAEAESLRAQGLGFWKDQEWQKALDCWSEGRDAAILAEDSHLTDGFESLIMRLADSRQAPLETREQAHRILKGSDDLEDLRRCLEDLERNPGDSRLQTQRDALIHQLLAQVKDSLETEQWEAARQIVEEVLRARPEEAEAHGLLRRAQNGLTQQWLARAEHALSAGRLDEARDLCNRILEIEPDHARAREILRDIEVVSRRRRGGPSAYDQAYLAFEEARDANELDRAFEQLLEMRKLQPRSRHTQEAFDWYSTARIEALRRQLEEEPGEAHNLLHQVEKVLNLRPDFKPARKLREDLRRASKKKDYEDEKRKLTFEKLEEADEALLRSDPIAALAALKTVQSRRNQDLEPEVSAKRDEALALLGDMIDDLLREPTDTNLVQVEQLLKAYQLWDRSFVDAKRRQIAGVKEEAKAEVQLDKDLDKLRKLLDLKQCKGSPIRALREFDRQLRALEMDGSEVRAKRESEIVVMRDRVLRSMTPLQRARVWLYDRYYGTPGRKPAGKEKQR